MSDISEPIELSDVGRWLVWARQHRTMTQKDVANALEVSPRSVSRWERTGQISMRHFFELCYLYGRWPTELFARSPVRVLSQEETLALNNFIDILSGDQTQSVRF